MGTSKSKKEKIIVLAGLFLIALIGLVTFFRAGTEKKEEQTPAGSLEVPKNYSEVSPSQLSKLIKEKKNLVIVDIRSSEFFQEEHIVDSQSIPLEELAGFDFQFPKDHLVVIVGEGETVSQNNKLAAFFKKRGYEKINFLSGGFSSWKDSGSQAVSWGDPYSFIDSAKVTYIEPDELKKFLDEKDPIFILDVRGNSDFSSRRIPGAANIALENLEKERNKIPSNRIITVYGSTELEGFRAGVKLYDLNFYSALVLREGFSSWMEKGYPVEISNN